MVLFNQAEIDMIFEYLTQNGMNNRFVMTGTPKTTTIGRKLLFSIKYSSSYFINYDIVNLPIPDVVSPGAADSSGDYYAFHHDGSSWTIKEYGSKSNSYSLCQFIGE